MTIWIGDIQWGLQHGIFVRPEPILRDLQTIECRDALLTRSSPADGGNIAKLSPSPPAFERARKADEGCAEAEWPEADFIIGNPPFLGGKKLRNGRPATFRTVNGTRKLVLPEMPGLGDEYVNELFRVYEGKVAAESDLVCYWFYKAWAAIQKGHASSAGLVSTNSIRGGANRQVLAPIAAKGGIFEAWSDEPWTVDGAAVRVSVTCFSEKVESRSLNGSVVAQINSDLSPSGADLTIARKLPTNFGIASNGISKKGKFEIDGQTARNWMLNEHNPNLRSNFDVILPWWNGAHVVSNQRADMWIISFNGMSEQAAALYEAPFEYVQLNVKPFRDRSASDLERRNWWRLARPASGLFAALGDKSRCIVTPEVSKHRVFVWCPKGICPDKNLVVTSRDDDTTFGILHSRFHEAWSLRLGTSLGVTPRYTPTTTFETFPFPENLTPNIPAATYASDPRAQKIAAAAKRLDDLRKAWLNPPDLVDIVPEIIPTAAPGEAPVKYPDRILPKNAEAAVKLKQRTLTNLYNQRPQWLADAHAAIDRAVAAAYGWPDDIATEAALEKLLALNLQRAAGQ